MEAVCYTLEGALEKAIEQEQRSFEIYRRVLKIVKNQSARKLLKELALEELEHKHALEKALIGETVGLVVRPERLSLFDAESGSAIRTASHEGVGHG